ncbi:23S rRNA (pseudouridine(1915)-N(3))-methyltransferase RlmH [bacterium]|nr:23S rRNA (pseudouridine(1915)-N(3))-methyltransferase RlmH [bacterium]
MRIEIHIMGKIKNLFIKDGVREYLKRMNGKGWQIKFVEKSNYKEVKETEWIILSEHGQKCTFKEFCNILTKGYSSRKIRFLIGPPEGFTKKFLINKKVLSLSSLMFSAEISALVLSEQIYRFWTVEKGKTYVR